jgi:hypothetical protein
MAFSIRNAKRFSIFLDNEREKAYRDIADKTRMKSACTDSRSLTA